VHHLFAFLAPFARFIARRPLIVLGVAVVVTAIAAQAAMQLRVDSDFANLLPRRYTSVQALLDLRTRVGAESPVDVAIESPSFEANRRFAEALIPRALTLRGGEGEPYFSRVDYRRDVGVLVRHAPYFATYEELDRLEDAIRAGASHVREAADPLPAGERAREIVLDPQEDMMPAATDVADVLEDLGLQEFPISEDSTVLALRFYPTGSQTDIGFIDALYADLDSLLGAMEPERVHPAMRVTTAGRLLRQSVEVHAITDDVQGSFGLGVAVVLLTVVGYFVYKNVQARSGGRFRPGVLIVEVARAPVLAAVIGLPLAMSLVWSFGIAAVAFGALNLMTATLGLVLFGMGIDFGIHFFARYAEERGSGRTVEEAIETTFVQGGAAIAATALTTGLALYVLTLADFRGFSEFGWIGGTGVLLALVSMLTVLPALVALAERLRLLNLTAAAKDSAATGTRRRQRYPFARSIVGLSVLGVGAGLLFAPRVEFEYDFNRLEPEFEAYEARAARVAPVYDSGRLRNPAYLLLDNSADVPGIVKALRRLAREDTLILAVESLQERFPTDPAEAQRKLERLRSLRALLDDPFLQFDTTGTVGRMRELLTVPRPLPLDSVPDFITRPFTDRSGRIGNFILVYPSASLGDARNSIHFARLVGEVTTGRGHTVYAGSTSLVAADTLRLMQDETPRMVWIVAVLVVVIMGFEFRSVRWTILGLIPLVVGILWMLAGMEAFGLTLTFYNLVVLPTVLGVGEDGGVHLVHRYRELGPGSLMTVLRTTGEHVFMSALTVLMGFGGLMTSFHPGLRSIGTLAVLGVGSTLVAALLFLPALIQVIEDARERRKNRPPRRRLPRLDVLFPEHEEEATS
jgi:hypothetical protein